MQNTKRETKVLQNEMDRFILKLNMDFWIDYALNCCRRFYTKQEKFPGGNFKAEESLQLSNIFVVYKRF